MPRLGEAVEPARAERLEPWWRVVDDGVRESADAPPPATLPKTMPWPID
jgi:hypothetical protein